MSLIKSPIKTGVKEYRLNYEANLRLNADLEKKLAVTDVLPRLLDNRGPLKIRVERLQTTSR